MQNNRVIAFDAVHDDVFAYWKTTQTGAQVVRALAADSRVLRQHPESVCHGSIRRLAISMLQLWRAT
jgi:hypothetical protein